MAGLSRQANGGARNGDPSVSGREKLQAPHRLAAHKAAARRRMFQVQCREIARRLIESEGGNCESTAGQRARVAEVHQDAKTGVPPTNVYTS